jgi:radical SAM superfamily enzyme
MVQTARYIGESGADGIKFHLLHVLRGTDLAELWQNGQIPILEREAYLAVLEDCIRWIPREMVIHRLTGDGAKRDLLAPLWSADKKRVLNAIRAAFARDDLEQGSALQR